MKQGTLNNKYRLQRKETLDEIARLRSMTTNGYITRGLDLVKSRLIKKWATPPKSTISAEKKAAMDQKEQGPTLNGRNRGRRWCYEDEQFILSAEMPDQAIAIRIGRTTKAVRRKRSKLMGNNSATKQPEA